MSQYYLNARYYDPQIGRFLSKDRIGFILNEPVGLNPFTYLMDNPVMTADPSGELAGPIIHG
ncbi:hypothetical protein I6N90_05770 [Paenibacillus sp. GSMTC-2017]|uniref:RHS repeat-associated core domain-containing protein n=1 Tax=Paenibacillus sp. GSMTC-2017 TaxID=2794350 RepID=UPI0018D8E902|nr:hypothetical protein [Paenibacillus sp. GSMTC-2017]